MRDTKFDNVQDSVLKYRKFGLCVAQDIESGDITLVLHRASMANVIAEIDTKLSYKELSTGIIMSIMDNINEAIKNENIPRW